jgi:hypothetical protein
MTLRITGVSDFARRPVFYKLENTKFRKLNLFPSSGERRTPTLLGYLGRANFNHWTSDWTGANLNVTGPVIEVSPFIRDPTE